MRPMPPKSRLPVPAQHVRIDPVGLWNVLSAGSGNSSHLETTLANMHSTDSNSTQSIEGLPPRLIGASAAATETRSARLLAAWSSSLRGS